MAFTFGEDLTVARDYVRFWTGDTVSPGFMSDTLIASMIAVEGSNNAAVIAGLRYIIMQLSKPDFRADWLQVSNAEARKGYESTLRQRCQQFGIALITASVQHVYRADSLMTEAPDYSEGV